MSLSWDVEIVGDCVGDIDTMSGDIKTGYNI